MKTDVPRAWLRQLRLERGFTLKEMGEKVNVAGAYVADIEHGRRNPSSNLAYKFSQVLGCPMENFYHDCKPNELRGKARTLKAEREKEDEMRVAQ